MMAESLFRVFDEDKSGTLSFEEYFQASQVRHRRQYKEAVLCSNYLHLTTHFLTHPGLHPPEFWPSQICCLVCVRGKLNKSKGEEK